VQPGGGPTAASPTPAASGGATDPAPAGGSKPSAQPRSEPVPPPNGTTSVGTNTAADQPVAVDVPATSDAGAKRLPAAVSDRPAPTPSTAACRELLSRIRTMAAPAAASAGGEKAGGDVARDMVLESAGGVVPDPAVAMLLVLAGGALIVLWLRAIPGRRQPS
jgi:hypothetical protein